MFADILCGLHTSSLMSDHWSVIYRSPVYEIILNETLKLSIINS